MNKPTKALLTLGGVVTAIWILVKSTEETDEQYYARELDALIKRQKEINRRWNEDHMSLNDAVHLQNEERAILKRKDEIEAKLSKLNVK